MDSQPSLALRVQVGQVWPRGDHPVEQRFQLGSVAVADLGHLSPVAKARRLLHQELAQRLRVAQSQDLAELVDVISVARRHLVAVSQMVSFRMGQRSTG